MYKRQALRAALAGDPSSLQRLESVVHPLLRSDRADFLAANTEAEVVLFDIPLLFETGLDAEMNGTATVSIDPETQSDRVLARGGMDRAALDLILSRQMTDADRRARARWVIPTETMAGAQSAVDAILAEIGTDA